MVVRDGFDVRKEMKMPDEKRFLVDVGMQNLPFPVRAHSRDDPNGQNFGMLHSYSTMIQTEMSAWVPFGGYDDPF
jgi:hypothetical protein